MTPSERESFDFAVATLAAAFSRLAKAGAESMASAEGLLHQLRDYKAQRLRRARRYLRARRRRVSAGDGLGTELNRAVLPKHE